ALPICCRSRGSSSSGGSGAWRAVEQWNTDLTPENGGRLRFTMGGPEPGERRRIARPNHEPLMILYLHGFRSSPQSYKARLMAAALEERGLKDQWWCGQLPASPGAAMALALQRAEEWLAAGGRREDLAVVGS